MPSGESDLFTVTCAQGRKMHYRLKEKNRVGLDPYLLGNGLSLFKSFPFSDTVVISGIRLFRLPIKDYK